MMTIAITLSGQTQMMSVENINFVVPCRYHRCKRDPDGVGAGRFLTIDPDKLYCVSWHRIKQAHER